MPPRSPAVDGLDKGVDVAARPGEEDRPVGPDDGGTAFIPGSFRARSSSASEAFTSCSGSVTAPVNFFGYCAHNADVASLMTRASTCPP